MTLVTARGNMCAREWPVSIVDGEGSRLPARVRGMAIGTGSRNCQCRMARIGCIVIICLMTAYAC